MAKLKIFFNSMDGSGHTNACIGFAQSLLCRGHQIYFFANRAFKGQFSRYGFDEILFENPTTKSNSPIAAIAQNLLQSGLLSDRTPLEKLEIMFSNEKRDNFWQDMLDTAVHDNEQIAKAIADLRPDVIILDQMLILPAVAQSTIPYVLLFSGNPLGLYHSPKLPPCCSGFAIDSDPSTWQQFRQSLKIVFERMRHYQTLLNQKFNFEPSEDDDNYDSELAITSKYLNIYGYPKELDYDDVGPELSSKFVRVDAFCRDETNDEVFELPFVLLPKDRLIYVSLGSMGSINVELMKRIVSILAKTPHKYIISKGPLHDQYDLPENFWGRESLPQTQILPLVDLVITHGGNNTVTESFSFGKAMIVLPLFADQYDNAQRINVKGFGIRLDTFNFAEKELIGSIDQLLSNVELKEKFKLIKQNIQQRNSKIKACEQLEAVVEMPKI